MRWILSVKDHLAGLIALMCIPRKRPMFVVHELDGLFGLLGFPNIFHTNNGTKFVA